MFQFLECSIPERIALSTVTDKILKTLVILPWQLSFVQDSTVVFFFFFFFIGPVVGSVELCVPTGDQSVISS